MRTDRCDPVYKTQFVMQIPTNTWREYDLRVPCKSAGRQSTGCKSAVRQSTGCKSAVRRRTGWNSVVLQSTGWNSAVRQSTSATRYFHDRLLLLVFRSSFLPSGFLLQNKTIRLLKLGIKCIEYRNNRKRFPIDEYVLVRGDCLSAIHEDCNLVGRKLHTILEQDFPFSKTEKFIPFFAIHLKG